MSKTIARWEQMVAAQPNNDLARFSLAKALFDDGRFAESLPHLEHALQRKPDWMVVQILVGKTHLALGRRDEARAAFIRGRELAVAQHHEGPQAELDELLADLE